MSESEQLKRFDATDEQLTEVYEHLEETAVILKTLEETDIPRFETDGDISGPAADAANSVCKQIEKRVHGEQLRVETALSILDEMRTDTEE